MRPYRIGASSGRRVCACCSRRSIGSRRPGPGSQAACAERGSSPRAAFPRAARSAGVKCGTAFGPEEIPPGARSRPGRASRPRRKPSQNLCPDVGLSRPRSSSSYSFRRLLLRSGTVVGECVNGVANAVEDVAFADRRDHSSTFPKERGLVDGYMRAPRPATAARPRPGSGCRRRRCPSSGLPQLARSPSRGISRRP